MQKKKSSKELLKESVIDLVSRMPVGKVTVNMIFENCGVSQRTFYNYFRDKLDLITWSYISILDEGRASAEDVTLKPVMTSLVENLVKFSDFYTSVIRYTGQNNFRESLFIPFRSYIRWMIADVFGDTCTDEISDAVDFFVFGCLGYMEHCFVTGNIVPAGITVSRFERNMPEILKKYL